MLSEKGIKIARKEMEEKADNYMKRNIAHDEDTIELLETNDRYLRKYAYVLNGKVQIIRMKLELDIEEGKGKIEIEIRELRNSYRYFDTIYYDFFENTMYRKMSNLF